MTLRNPFSLHGNTLRYRGEDVAVVCDPNIASVDDFLRALHSIPDVDIDTLEQDITDLSAEVDYLRLEAAKALKFLAVADLLAVHEHLRRIVEDAP